MSDFLIDEELLAAIDMGSNSFHLAIARVDHGEVKKVASMSEKVQLAAGLDENKNLTEAAQQRGLACLARFVGRLGSVQPKRLRIVATNALRQAKNGQEFIQKAKNVHKDKFDYSLVIYKTARDYVTIICPIHGEFEQTPNNHLRGRGCNECRFEKSTSEAENKITEFLKNLNINQFSILQKISTDIQ